MGILDQVVSSGTNFLFTLSAARALSPREFGVLTLAVSVVYLSLALVRATINEVYAVRSGGVQRADQGALRAASGSVLLGGFLVATVMACMAPFLAPTSRGIVLGIAPFLPAVLLQDFWRYALFAHGRRAAAIWNDLTWALILGILLAGLHRMGAVAPWTLAAVWMGAGAACGVFGAVQMGVVPLPKDSLVWWRSHRGLSVPFLAESVALQVASQAALYGIALVAGEAAVGALRAGSVFVGPVSLAQAGYYLYALPEASRRVRASDRDLLSFCVLSAVVLTAAPLVWLLVLWSLPPRWGVWLLRRNWRAGAQLAPILCLSLAGIGLGIGATLGLRGRQDVHRSVRTRLMQALIATGVPWVGGALRGTRGAAWGVAISGLVTGIVWWIALVRSFRDASRAGALQASRSLPEPPNKMGGAP